MNISDLPLHILRRIIKYLDLDSLIVIAGCQSNKDLMTIAIKQLNDKYSFLLSSRIIIFDDNVIIKSNEISSLIPIKIDDEIKQRINNFSILERSRNQAELTVVYDNNQVGVFENGSLLPMYTVNNNIVKIAGSTILTSDNELYLCGDKQPYVPDFIIVDIADYYYGSYLYILTNEGKVHIMNVKNREIIKDVFPDKKIKSISTGLYSLNILTEHGEILSYCGNSVIPPPQYSSEYSYGNNKGISISSIDNTKLILLNDKTVIGDQTTGPLYVPSIIQGHTICVKSGHKLCAAVLTDGRIIIWNIRTHEIIPNKLRMF